MRRTTLCFLAALGVAGCTGETQTFDPPAPSLTLVATGPCEGQNIVPTTAADRIVDGELAGVARLTVTGIDAGNASGDMSAGTRVSFRVVEPETEEDRLRAGFGGFVTTRGQEIPGQPVASDPVEFVGRTAQESFYCQIPGTVLIEATVEDYQPAAGGDARTLTTRILPVRCQEPAVYQRTCELGEVPDMALPDDDGGMGGDMGVGDGGMDAVVDLPGELTIAFVPPEDESDLVIGIRGSGLGRPDSVVLRFRVTRLDEPVARRTVNFALPNSAPPNVEIVPRQAQTDDLGFAQVRLLAGGTPGVVTVTATTAGEEPDDEPLFDRSGVVVIRGGVPAADRMQFHCDDLIIPAFVTRQDAGNWRFGASEDDGTECTVQLADRIGGQADISTRAFFLTEAGSVTQESVGDEFGVARTAHRIGPRAPYDTSPLPYEIANGHDGIFNPRDGLVRLVAVTRGEEAFTDVDGNKIYTDGIDFVTPEQDLGEPFVDVNDNGRYDNDEIARIIEDFRDTDRDGVWSPPNGTWDGDTEIWDSTLVLWVGNLHVDPLDPEIRPIYSYCLEELGCARRPNFNADCPPSDFYLDAFGSVVLETRFADRNGNCLDGYEEGTTSISTDGALETDRDGFDYINRCFVRVDEEGDPIVQPHPLTEEPMYFVGDGRVEYPLAARHTYAVFDTAGAPDFPVVSTIEVSVSYREVGGDNNVESFGFTVCR